MHNMGVVWRRERIFYSGMALGVAVAVFAGFARTYYFCPYFQTTPLRPLLHLHGFVFTTWILLLVAQTSLVAARRTDLHRRLGMAGAVLAVVMVVVGMTAAIVTGRENVAAGIDEALSFFATPVADMLVFITLVAAAVRYRRRPEAHKRLMLLATLSILDAAVARWPLTFLATSSIAFFAVTDLFLVAGVLYDVVSRRRVHPAYVWGGLLLVVSQPLRLVVGQTEAWQAFARLVLR